MKQKTVFLIVLVVLLLDQVSKYAVKATGQYTTNTGIAFGLLPNNNAVFIVVAIAIIIVLFYYAMKYPSLGLALLLGGASGNLIDRIVLGHVIDFINIGWWPSFNLADTANSIGVFLLLFTKKL